LVVVVRGGPADNSIGLDRTNGMLSVVGKTSMTVQRAPDFGGWSEDGGFKVMEGMLARFKKIDVVFCENDSMCEGAQKAIKDAGRSNEMFLTSIDGEKVAVKGDHAARHQLRSDRQEQFRPDRSRGLPPADRNSRGRRCAEEDGAALAVDHPRQRRQIL